MARPLSEEKRTTIIEAAIDAIAVMGTGASTAKISIAAGVSEGTVFTYFPTKDELLNVVYLEIKQGLAKAMLGAYPADATRLERTRHVWNGYINWGHGYPNRRKTMQQLAVSEKITQESRKLGIGMFDLVNGLLAESPGASSLEAGAATFNGALMESVASSTLEFMAKEPLAGEAYSQAGFAFFWNGLNA